MGFWGKVTWLHVINNTYLGHAVDVSEKKALSFCTLSMAKTFEGSEASSSWQPSLSYAGNKARHYPPRGTRGYLRRFIFLNPENPRMEHGYDQ